MACVYYRSVSVVKAQCENPKQGIFVAKYFHNV